MKYTRPAEFRHIARMEEYDKKGNRTRLTPGWQVYMKMGAISKFFSDKKYGSKENALKEAQLFRDASVKELKLQKKPQGISPKYDPNKHLTDRNTSGIVGVSLYRHSKKEEYLGWIAQWVDYKRKKKSKVFYFRDYGYDGAKQKAIEYREKAIKEKIQKITLFGRPVDESRIKIKLKEPKNKDSKLWRYMDFTKFVSLIDKKGLFFAQSDKFDDLFEGSYSYVNKKYRDTIQKQIAKYKNTDIADISTMIKNIRKRVFINCWHMNEIESAAMWKLYSKTNESVCIQTTFKKLKNNFEDNINIGMVQYVDYNTNWIPESDPLAPFFFKRLSFSHEQEVRLLVYDEKIDKPGVTIPIDIQKTVERIFISPEAPKWFRDLTESILKLYKLKIDVIKSSLELEPFF